MNLVVATSAGIAVVGIVLVAIGVRSSSPKATRARTEKLHSSYVVANYSRLFIACGAALVIIGGIVAIRGI